MVILNDVMKTIRNGVFLVFFEEEKPVFKKPKNPRMKKTKN